MDHTTDTKATLKCGYARLSNLLLEALSSAPLSGVELKIVLFVIRRTYGWAQANDPTSGKADVMSAVEIAQGIRVSPRTVERPLTGLVKNCILIRLEAKDKFVKYAYGINTNVEEWGAEGGDWRFFHTELREAQQAGAYTQKSVVGIRKIAYRVYAEERIGSTLNSVEVQAENHCATGAQATPTDSITDSITENVPPTPQIGLLETVAGNDNLPQGESENHAIAGATANTPERPDHYALVLAIEGAYPTAKERKRNAHLAVFLEWLGQPGCPYTEAQLVASLESDLPQGPPESYIRHLIGLANTTRAAPARAAPVVAAESSTARPPTITDVMRDQGAAEETLVEMPDQIKRYLGRAEARRGGEPERIGA